MSWREQLQPASFRGVAFNMVGGDAGFGRRAYKVEYPWREDGFVDDMGRRLREYSVEAVFIGDDLFEQRSRLIDALEQPGPAVLIHPRLGALWVQVERGRWSFKPGSNKERLTIQFLEAGDAPQPQTQVDTLDQLNAAADAAGEAQLNAFEKAFSVAGEPQFILDSAIDWVNQGLDGLRKINGAIATATDPIAALSQTINSTLSEVGTLIHQPRALAGRVADLVNQVLGSGDRLTTLLDGYRNLGALWGDAEPIPETTPTRKRQAANASQVTQLFQGVATVEAARQVSTLAQQLNVSSNAQSPFDSADHAYAVRDELLADLEAQALQADDDLYRELVNLQVALVSHIDAHGNTLPRVTRVRFNQALPALVIAHQIYGDARHEADLVTRNGIRHPLFVAAQRELEVLNG